VTPDTLAPPFFLAAALLVLAGVVKLRSPDATAQAIMDAGLPGSRTVARGVGVAEIVIGAWALGWPAAGGAPVCGALYAAFAGFLVYVLVARPDAGSCGCAGPTAVPPSRLHATLNIFAAIVAFAYATTAAPSLETWARSLGWEAVPVAFGAALAGWLCVVSVTAVPDAFRAWSPPEHDHDAEPHGHDHAVTDRELATAGVVTGHPSLWPGTKP
jgi:Methylamine utilisation protein MauE